MSIKKFNEFTPLNEDIGGGNNARQALADLSEVEEQIAKEKRARVMKAKEWAAASDSQRADLLDELKKMGNNIKELELQANAKEDEFNVASGVTVIEEDDDDGFGEIEDEEEGEFSAPEDSKGGEEIDLDAELGDEEAEEEVPVDDLNPEEEVEEDQILFDGDHLVFNPNR